MERIPTLLAYFITFSTYGSRVAGDEKGSVDRRANSYGEPTVATSHRLAGAQRETMRWPPFRMADHHRVTVAAAIAALCRKHEWRLLALNVRTNHVHLVVEPLGGTPEAPMTAVKATATGALRRAGLVDPVRKIWARHGSTRYLFEEAAVPSAVVYVVDRQGANLDGAWLVAPEFDW